MHQAFAGTFLCQWKIKNIHRSSTFCLVTKDKNATILSLLIYLPLSNKKGIRDLDHVAEIHQNQNKTFHVRLTTSSHKTNIG